jgi:hypothetical protein
MFLLVCKKPQFDMGGVAIMFRASIVLYCYRIPGEPGLWPALDTLSLLQFSKC